MSKKEPKSKYVERKDGELYIKGRRVNIYAHQMIARLFDKPVVNMTDDDIEEYEEWREEHGSVVTPSDIA